MEAIRLSQKPGVTARSVEQDLGLYHAAIAHWSSELGKRGKDAFPGVGHQSELEEENRRLRRQLSDARLERDISETRWPYQTPVDLCTYTTRGPSRPVSSGLMFMHSTPVAVGQSRT